MSPQTELSLTSLLPTHSFLPPELLALSNSLLAQSRAKAASLKPEEEVARTYACCHIACERLGNKLALDIGKPRPPVKPRVYEKLKAYFNAVLKTGGSAPSTPRTKRVGDKLEEGSAARSGGARGRGGSAAVQHIASPLSTTRKRTATGALKSSLAAAEPPQYILPFVRHLCREYSTSKAIPHVYTGVCTLFGTAEQDTASSTAKSRRSRSAPLEGASAEDEGAVTVIAVFALTCQKMYGLRLLEDEAEFDSLARKTEVYLNDNHMADATPSEYQDVASALKTLLDKRRHEWETMEWYENIPPINQIEDNEADPDDERDENDEQRSAHRPAKTPLRRREKHAKRPLDINDVGAAGLLPGLGTMFQPAVDWLSDERRDHFVQWKQGILNELRDIGTVP